MLFLYTAVHGDTLDNIARRFGCDVDKLMELNIIGGNGLTGQRLLIQSDIAMPEWMTKSTLCFDDLDCRQLSRLMYRCTNIVDNKKELPNEDVICRQMEKIEVSNVDDEAEQIISEQNIEKESTTELKTVDKQDDDVHLQHIGASNLQAYTVAEGEKLADIAIKHGVTVGMLQKCGASANVVEGEVIRIPIVQGRRFFYTVRLGDTAEKIALRFGCSKEKIINTNFLGDNERLVPGTQLLILV